MMDTRKSFKHKSNFYDGENVGRDSPAALLDMLAEVASQTLHSEKEQSELAIKGKSKRKYNSLNRKNQDFTFTVYQLLSMPTTQLIKQFSIFTSDELKRQYSYVCALMPGCEQKYTSFASEERARMSIKAHLEDHLEVLKTNKETYSLFRATAVKQRKLRANILSKKNKIQRTKKPQETLNKENKEVKTGRSTNYLRNILTNELKFPEVENQIEKENAFDVKMDQEESDVKVLRDHSYYESTKDNEAAENLASNVNTEIVTEASEENIVLMVVQSDGVLMKEVPYVSHKITEDPSQEAVYLPDPIQTEEVYARDMEVAQSKPKGKAKFIGTSREEKEMALALMEKIKKKGNPSGNNLQCRICDPPRTFTAPTTLVSHYRSHAGIKPYECRICRSVFTRRHSLKYHMLIHQNQTRFTCIDCGKKFRHPSHFREHRRRHTGEAPFGCEDCGQRFKTRNTYKRHLKTRHGKVLTTSGELLHLSEEDFQKVRTSRKKKADPLIENIISEDIISPAAILQYDDSNCDDPEAETQDYKDYNQFVNDQGTVWMTQEMMQDMKGEENYDNNYEVETDESRIDKTGFIETEEATESEEFDSEHLYDEVTEEKEAKESVILDGTQDVNLEVSKTETEILYEKTFNETQELYNVEEYENQIQNVGEEILDFQEGEQQILDVVEEVLVDEESGIQSEEDSTAKENSCDDFIFCSQEANLSPFDNEPLKMEEISIQEDENFVSQEDEVFPDEHHSTESFEDIHSTEKEMDPEIKGNGELEETLLYKENYLQTESVLDLDLEQEEKVKVESCVPTSQFQSQPTFQITKDGKITLFGKPAQAINIVQNGKQSAILLLSNGEELNRNFFKINQNAIFVKGLKTLPVVAAPDK